MMIKKWTLLAWLALGLVCGSCQRHETTAGNETVVADKSTWLTDLEKAQTQARAKNKMLLINFTGSDWCPPCIMLHRQVFSQPEFADYAAKNLVLLEVDFPRTKEQSAEQKAANQKLAESFGIYGFPTLIVLNAAGKKIGELGYMRGGPKAFIAELEKLRHGS